MSELKTNLAKEADRFFLAYLPYDNLDEGTIVDSWPTHMTMLPWLKGDINRAIIGIKNVLSDEDEFTFGADRTNQWDGLKGQVDVIMAEPAERLRTLHKKLWTATKEFVSLHAKSMYILDSYNPHFTQLDDQKQVEVGDLFDIDSLTLLYKKDDQRIIGEKIKLGRT